MPKTHFVSSGDFLERSGCNFLGKSEPGDNKTRIPSARKVGVAERGSMSGPTTSHELPNGGPLSFIGERRAYKTELAAHVAWGRASLIADGSADLGGAVFFRSSPYRLGETKWFQGALARRWRTWR